VDIARQEPQCASCLWASGELIAIKVIMVDRDLNIKVEPIEL
jgi:hypothetical protein